MIRLKNLPFIPNITSDETMKLVARDIMIRDPPQLARFTTFSTLIQRLKMDSLFPEHFVVVDSMRNGLVLGSVSRESLRKACQKYRFSKLMEAETEGKERSRETLETARKRVVENMASVGRASNRLDVPHLQSPLSAAAAAEAVAASSVSASATNATHHSKFANLTQRSFQQFLSKFRGRRRRIVRAPVEELDAVDLMTLEGAVDLYDFFGLEINSTPNQVVQQTPIIDVIATFSMLYLQWAIVTEFGRVVGIINKQRLADAVTNPELFLHPEGGSAVSLERSEKPADTAVSEWAGGKQPMISVSSAAIPSRLGGVAAGVGANGANGAGVGANRVGVGASGVGVGGGVTGAGTTGSSTIGYSGGTNLSNGTSNFKGGAGGASGSFGGARIPAPVATAGSANTAASSVSSLPLTAAQRGTGAALTSSSSLVPTAPVAVRNPVLSTMFTKPKITIMEAAATLESISGNPVPGGAINGRGSNAINGSASLATRTTASDKPVNGNSGIIMNSAAASSVLASKSSSSNTSQFTSWFSAAPTPAVMQEAEDWEHGDEDEDEDGFDYDDDYHHERGETVRKDGKLRDNLDEIEEEDEEDKDEFVFYPLDKPTSNSSSASAAAAAAVDSSSSNANEQAKAHSKSSTSSWKFSNGPQDIELKPMI